MTNRKVLVNAGKNNVEQIPNTDIAEVGNGVTSSVGGSLGLFGSAIIPNTNIIPYDDKVVNLGDIGYLLNTIYSDKLKINEISLYGNSDLIEKVCSLNWHAITVSGSESWILSEDGTPQQNSTDTTANLFLELDFLQGSQISSIKLRFSSPGTVLDPLPGNFPTFNLIKQNYTTNSTSIIGSTSLSSVGSGYRGTQHEVTVDAASEVIDNANYRYYLLITPESGSDSQIGGLVLGMKKYYLLPSGTILGLE